MKVQKSEKTNTLAVWLFMYMEVKGKKEKKLQECVRIEWCGDHKARYCGHCFFAGNSA